MEGEKNKRAPNFSNDNVTTLLELVKKYKSIIECKKTDTVTWKEKYDAWEKITMEFNKETGVNRTLKTIRDKYKNLKTDSRKKFAEERCRLFKTGGGEYKPVKITKTDIDLKELAGISVTGLNNPYDGDAYSDNENEKIIFVCEDENLDENVSTGEIEDLPIPSTSYDFPSTSQNLQQFPISEITHLTSEENDFDTCIENTENDMNWKSWNPKMLKTPKTNVLQSKNQSKENTETPNTKKSGPYKKKTILTQDCRTKINSLSGVKIELNKLLIECAQKELEMKIKEHELNIKHLQEKLDNKRELHKMHIIQKKLEIELLKQKLSHSIN